MPEDQDHSTVVSSWVPPRTARALQAQAAQEDRSISAVVRRAIEAHLQAVAPSSLWASRSEDPFG